MSMLEFHQEGGPREGKSIYVRSEAISAVSYTHWGSRLIVSGQDVDVTESLDEVLLLMGEVSIEHTAEPLAERRVWTEQPDQNPPTLTYEWQIHGTGWGNTPTYGDTDEAAQNFADLLAKDYTNITLVRRQVGAWQTVEES